MQPNLKLQLRFVDRIGIVSDIAAILTQNGLNIAFREDLYCRINVLPIHIPPLRERPGGIPPAGLNFHVF